MEGIDLKKILYIGNICELSRKGRRICSLYRTPDKLFIGEVVPSTNFEIYYFYPVSKAMILSYITNKKMKHALPVSGTVAYKIKLGEENQVMDIMDAGKIPQSHLTLNDTEWQCEDYYNITTYLAKKSKK